MVFDKCPICGKKLVEKYYLINQYGIEDYSRECEKRCFSEKFIDGNYILQAPYMSMNFNRNVTQEEKKAILNIILSEKNNWRDWR